MFYNLYMPYDYVICYLVYNLFCTYVAQGGILPPLDTDYANIFSDSKRPKACTETQDQRYKAQRISFGNYSTALILIRHMLITTCASASDEGSRE